MEPTFLLAKVGFVSSTRATGVKLYVFQVALLQSFVWIAQKRRHEIEPGCLYQVQLSGLNVSSRSVNAEKRAERF